MNDRIRELLVQSGFCFWADEEWGPGPGKVSWDCDYEKEFDKFVELLVQECATIAALVEYKGGENSYAVILDNFEVPLPPEEE